MSDYGEAIIDRLGNTSKITIDSDMGRIINYTIGEWLQREDDEPFFEQFFLQEATGKYLDLHGRTFDVLRKIDESDDDYRQRIIYASLGYLTIDFLRTVYGVQIYSFEENFNVNNNTLVSDNPYYPGKLMADATSEVKSILEKKFVIGSEIAWL